MSITAATPTPPSSPPEVRSFTTGSRMADAFARSVMRALVIVGVLVLVEAITGEGALTDGGTAAATLRLAMPILLAGLGGMFAERSGIVNIGLEGMMILGTWFAAFFGFELGVWWGLVMAGVGGALGGLLLAIAAVTFGVNHIVAGVAVNLIAPGVTRFLAGEFFIDRGGSLSNSPQVEGRITTIDFPWIGDISLAILLSLAMVPFSWYVLWRTPFGLRLRSAGEQPWAADSLGVGVYRMQYAGVVISGALAGFGGGLLVIEGANIYREGQTGGRGFIALAAMIFGNWRPGGTLVGALLFGYILALQLRSESAVHALLLLTAVAGAAACLYMLYKKQYLAAAWTGALAAAAAVVYFSTDDLPSQLVFTSPYVVTLVVLAFASQRLRPPRWEGIVWRRGDVGG